MGKETIASKSPSKKREGKTLAKSGPSLKSKSKVTEPEPPLNIMEYYAKPSARCSVTYLGHIIEKFESGDSNPRMDMLRKSCFGFLLNIVRNKTMFSPNLTHYLWQRHSGELTFNIEGVTMTFTPLEFTLITGLRWADNPPPILDNTKGGRLTKKYFKSSSVTQSGLATAIENCEVAEDSVKLALVLLLESYFLGSNRDYYVPLKYMQLVDDLDSFNKYPWGNIVYDTLKKAMEGAIRHGRRPTKYSIFGCAYALQAWIYERIPQLGHLCAKRENDPKWPRILNWYHVNNPPHHTIKELIHDDKCQILEELSLTRDELSREVLEPFLAKSSEGNEVEDEMATTSTPPGSPPLPPKSVTETKEKRSYLERLVNEKMDMRFSSFEDRIERRLSLIEEKYMMRISLLEKKVEAQAKVMEEQAKIIEHLTKPKGACPSSCSLSSSSSSKGTSPSKEPTLANELIANIAGAEEELNEKEPTKKDLSQMKRAAPWEQSYTISSDDSSDSDPEDDKLAPRMVSTKNGGRSRSSKVITSEVALIRRAEMYQEYMKHIPIPARRGSVIPFTSWQGLARSVKQLYRQPLHYLTNILLKQLDQSRIGGGDEGEHRPLDTVIHPSKAEALIWVTEEVHRLTSSHHHLAKLWASDPMYHAYVDPIIP